VLSSRRCAPTGTDVVERSAELDGDVLGFDADVEITRSVSACPRPQVSVELLMQVTEERVRENIGEHESPVGDVIEQRDADLIVDRLLGLVEVDLLRLIAEDLHEPAGEGVCFFRVQRRFAVAGLTTRQTRCLRRGEEALDPFRASDTDRHRSVLQRCRRPWNAERHDEAPHE
jgi:hypothetical protein